MQRTAIAAISTCLAIGLGQPAYGQQTTGAPESAPPSAATPAPESGPAPAEDPYAALARQVRASTGEHLPLAFIRPEAIGTERSLADLEAALLDAWQADPGLAVIPPDEVQRLAGDQFAATPAGVAKVAQACKAGSALLLRWIQSSEGIELYPLLVDAAGQVLLDRAFELAAPPAPSEDQAATDDAPVPEPTEGIQAETSPAPEAQGPDPAAEYTRLRMELIPRPGRPNGFLMQRGGQFVGELELAELVGRTDLMNRIQAEADRLHSRRNLGIGLTLGGFAAVGLATPFFKASEGSQIGGGLITGVGLAVGVTGLVLWTLYGDAALRAGGPEPVEHLLQRQEAEQAVRSYNDRLRRELNLPAEIEPEPVSVHWQLGPTDGGLAGALTLIF